MEKRIAAQPRSYQTAGKIIPGLFELDNLKLRLSSGTHFQRPNATELLGTLLCQNQPVEKHRFSTGCHANLLADCHKHRMQHPLAIASADRDDGNRLIH